MLKKTTLIFLTCIFLSSLFWIFNTLSKKTKQSIIKEINITNIPDSLILDSLSNQKIEITLEDYGLSLFKLYFSNKKININYNTVKNGIISLNKEIISTYIPSESKIIDIKPNNIICHFSKQRIKKVPINIDNIKINCKSPYRINQEKENWTKQIRN